MTRRQVLAAAGGLFGAFLASRRSEAQDIRVPIPLQVELLGRMAAYDRNFPARVNGYVRVLILIKRGDPDSRGIADHLSSALGRIQRIGGFPHEHATVQFEDTKTLVHECNARSTDIVYLTPGLDANLPQIVSGLTGLNLLSVSAVPAHVPERVVLGFDLVSGKPKMLVHLTQARMQHVEFRSDVLKLTRVYP